MPTEQKPKFSSMISTAPYKKAIANAITDPKRAASFVAAVTSAVSNNPDLQECDPATILTAALLGEGIGLSPSPQLGQYYLVPYDNRKLGIKVAQFTMGYKGYIQLAMRSAAYEKLTVIAIKDGEFISWNPMTEELRADFIEDQDKRDETPTVGYYAAFRLLNGFSKAIYWTRAKMERHAMKYSKGYAAKKGYTFWEREFDSMAYKTMLRQLLGHWGLMTVELQTALSGDVEDAEAVEVHTVNAVELPMQVEALPADTGATEAPKIAVDMRKTEPVQVVTREREKPSVSAQAREKSAPKMISLDDL